MFITLDIIRAVTVHYKPLIIKDVGFLFVYESQCLNTDSLYNKSVSHNLKVSYRQHVQYRCIVTNKFYSWPVSTFVKYFQGEC